MVAEEDVGAFDPDLTFFALRDFDTVGGHELDYLIREGRAVGAEAVAPYFLWQMSAWSI